MTQTFRLFAYGTLLDQSVQQKIIGREVPATPAILPGYTNCGVNINGTTYMRIEPEAGATIEGGVLEGITEAELARTDRYEGADYVRIPVTLADGSAAFVYVKPEGAA
jgi:gamma-glutamylcyclotransferase (GGCT)/AIG2-like uncharacterized protein YtfP